VDKAPTSEAILEDAPQPKETSPISLIPLAFSSVAQRLQN